MRFQLRSSVLAVPLLVACESPAAPLLVEGAQRVEPPPVYRLWWEMTQQCSGRPGLLARVRWYVVPGARTIVVQGRQLEGYWTPAGKAIVLAEEAMLDGSLVRHEMLHALHRVAGHPRGAFLERCAGVVLCDLACRAEAGPPPPLDPAVPRVAPDALELHLTVTPPFPTRAQYGGYFTVTVTARNPLDHPVVVNLPPPGDTGPGVSFHYRIDFPGLFEEFADRALDDGVTRFTAGETKRRVFDFHIVGPSEPTLGGGLRPDVYQFRGGYGGRWAPEIATVAVSPP